MAQSRRGFSLIEVMVSSLVLGVAVLGLTSTYTSSQTGMVASRSRTTAAELARQRLELLATQDATQLPACAGPLTCQQDGAMGPALAPSGAFRCTQYVDDMAVLDPADPAASGRYRVDTIVEEHPDALRQPDARLVTVNVCWLDRTGRVHEVQARRTIVPGV